MEKMNYEDFGFEIINIVKAPPPILAINVRDISFNKQVAELLNYPSHVFLHIQTDKKVVGVQVCKSVNKGATPFSKAKAKQKGAIKYYQTIINESIRDAMGDEWDENSRYQIVGTFHPEARGISFLLSDAEQIIKKERT